MGQPAAAADSRAQSGKVADWLQVNESSIALSFWGMYWSCVSPASQIFRLNV